MACHMLMWPAVVGSLAAAGQREAAGQNCYLFREGEASLQGSAELIGVLL
jgi:hypothetical protein